MFSSLPRSHFLRRWPLSAPWTCLWLLHVSFVALNTTAIVLVVELAPWRLKDCKFSVGWVIPAYVTVTVSALCAVAGIWLTINIFSGNSRAPLKMHIHLSINNNNNNKNVYVSSSYSVQISSQSPWLFLKLITHVPATKLSKLCLYFYMLSGYINYFVTIKILKLESLGVCLSMCESACVCVYIHVWV